VASGKRYGPARGGRDGAAGPRALPAAHGRAHAPKCARRRGGRHPIPISALPTRPAGDRGGRRLPRPPEALVRDKRVPTAQRRLLLGLQDGVALLGREVHGEGVTCRMCRLKVLTLSWPARPRTPRTPGRAGLRRRPSGRCRPASVAGCSAAAPGLLAVPIILLFHCWPGAAPTAATPAPVSPPGSMRCAALRSGAPGRWAHAWGGRPHGWLAARWAARTGPGWGFLSGAPGLL
jgi:hypothetical protein